MNEQNKTSLPAWGAWIEIFSSASACCFLSSLPAWGAWIEISRSIMVMQITAVVAPRMGSVD